MTQPRILIIAGPTASGKSSHALAIAEKTGGVIINADSQQVYQGLPVLTAQPSEADMQRVPHRLYGTLAPEESCSAGAWLQFAKMEIDWALSQNKLPIVVGGTGLYLKALTEGIADIPDIPEQIRTQARNDLIAMGNEAFHERLKAVDPVLGDRLNTNDTQRLTRAYEVWLGTGKPLSWWQSNTSSALYNKELFCISKVDIGRETLYENCDKRAAHMLENGAVEEVEALLKRNIPADRPAMRILGVPEISVWLSGECSKKEALEKLQQSTRNYAKRQLTWLRHQLTEDFLLPQQRNELLEALA